MKKIAFALSAIFISLALGLGQAARADSAPPDYYEYQDYDETGADLLTPEELDDLLAPIALYPDPLIAQILPAATFIDQIDAAARYVRQYGKAARIDEQPWDLSVRAVAHYPELLFMMDQKYEWTVSLGQAFVEQQQDVMDAIQRLRADAQAQGNLFSNREQQVIYDTEVIRIVPARPQYVYIPVYDPRLVYVERYNPYTPFITFSIGFTIGAWLNRDCNWHERRVYYHGWRGGEWINRARPHIHDRRGVYINRRASQIQVNNRVVQHDTRRFRQQLRDDAFRHREQRGPSAAPRLNRPRPGRIEPPRPGRLEQPRPGTIERPSTPGAVRPRSGTIERPTTPGAVQPRAVQPRAVQPQPGAVQPRPSAGQQRPGWSQQRLPGAGQPLPLSGEQRPARTVEPNAPATGRQSPSADGSQQAPPAATPQPVAAPGQSTPAATGRESGPATGGRPEASSESRDLFRGRDVQKAQPASRTGYGGYGSGKDASSYRQRGQSSREKIRHTNRPASAVAPAPAQAPTAAPAERPTIAPLERPTAAPAERPAVAPVPPRPAEAPARRPAHQLRERPDASDGPSVPRGGGQPVQRPAGREGLRQR